MVIRRRFKNQKKNYLLITSFIFIIDKIIRKIYFFVFLNYITLFEFIKFITKLVFTFLKSIIVSDNNIRVENIKYM